MAKKLVPRKIEMVIVGLQHRLTPSTRNMLERRVSEAPVEVAIEREPDNSFDEHAIKVIISDTPYKNLHIGYIPRGSAALLAPLMDTDEIKEIHGTMTDVQPMDGTATMLLQFKTAVNVKAPVPQGGRKRKKS